MWSSAVDSTSLLMVLVLNLKKTFIYQIVVNCRNANVALVRFEKAIGFIMN